MVIDIIALHCGRSMCNFFSRLFCCCCSCHRHHIVTVSHTYGYMHNTQKPLYEHNNGYLDKPLALIKPSISYCCYCWPYNLGILSPIVRCSKSTVLKSSIFIRLSRCWALTKWLSKTRFHSRSGSCVWFSFNSIVNCFMNELYFCSEWFDWIGFVLYESFVVVFGVASSVVHRLYSSKSSDFHTFCCFVLVL